MFAVVSLNGNGYRFDRDFDISSFAPGYWGNGTLTKQVTTHPDGSITYDLIGSGEPHGVIRFIGTFQTVSWTSLTNEYWNGFSIAIEHLAVNVPPEIGVYVRGAALTSGQLTPVDVGAFDVGTSTTIEISIVNSGTGPLNIFGMTLSGPDAGAFALGTVPPAIAAGSTTTVSLTFTASTAATYTASVTIDSDDADEAQFSFPITGGARIDTDGDGVIDRDDNCPSVPNADQQDTDQDGLGDVCDDDADGDGYVAGQDCDDLDAAIFEPATYFADTDADGYGDPDDTTAACTLTPPNGYVADGTDNCPLVSNADQADADGDGTGDACEGDEDGDGIPDDEDNCATSANPDQADLDDDGIGDVCDPDADGDGVPAGTDCDDQDAAVTAEETYYLDEDGDGFGDPASAEMLCAATPPPGYAENAPDNCPTVSNPDQADADQDGRGSACDDGEMLEENEDSDDEGCSCRASRRIEGPLDFALFFGLAGALWLRRRRIRN